MAWDGYRLPTFPTPVILARNSANTGTLDYLDLTLFDIVNMQVYWGLKRGFRYTIDPFFESYVDLPMMMKAPWGTGLSIGGDGIWLYPDWYFWSFRSLLWCGRAITVGQVALGQSNQYEGAVMSVGAFPLDTPGLILPAGWPLP